MWNDGAALLGVVSVIGFIVLLLSSPKDSMSKKRNHKPKYHKSLID